MRIKFAGIAMAMILLAGCASKQTVATPKPPTPPTLASVEAAKTTETILTPEEVAKGKNLYENNCAKCHKLFAPTDFTEKEWEPIMKKMQKKARLDDAQMASIMNYVSSELK